MTQGKGKMFKYQRQFSEKQKGFEKLENKKYYGFDASCKTSKIAEVALNLKTETLNGFLYEKLENYNHQIFSV